MQKKKIITWLDAYSTVRYGSPFNIISIMLHLDPTSFGSGTTLPLGVILLQVDHDYKCMWKIPLR